MRGFVMFKVEKKGVILSKREGVSFEEEGVFNPAVIEKDGVLHMFYRAVGKDNFSTLGYCQIREGKVVGRLDEPVLEPEFYFEKQGIEDPRITFLDGWYYLFYTAYDGKNAVVAYAVSEDLKKWEKRGVITPRFSYDEAEDIFRHLNLDKRYGFFERFFRIMRDDGVLLWEKDTALFSRKIKGKYALIHRILPGIQICYFDDLRELTDEFWRKHLSELDKHVVLEPKYWFEGAYIGGGGPPLETEDGWLLIYHAVEVKEGRKIYRAGAALLDKDDPQKVIGRLKEPLLGPEEEWEKQGVVSNVVFPTATIVNGEDLDIYYGAADEKVALAKVNLKKLLSVLKKEKV